MSTRQFYSLFIIGFVLLCASFLFTSFGSATEYNLYEYCSTNDNNEKSFISSVWVGQTVTIGTCNTPDVIGYKITRISLKLYKIGKPGYGYIHIGTQNISGYPLIDRNTLGIGVDWNILNTSSSWFDFDVNYNVFNSEYISIILSVNTGGLGNEVRWRYSNTNQYNGGSYAVSSDSGNIWSIDTNKDFMFKIYGEKLYSTDVTNYDNLINCTGRTDTVFDPSFGVVNWNNYSSYANLVENIVNATGTHEIICKNGVYTVWANYTGNVTGNGCVYPFFFNYSDENITVNITVNACENVTVDGFVNETDGNWVNLNGLIFEEKFLGIFFVLTILGFILYLERYNKSSIWLPILISLNIPITLAVGLSYIGNTVFSINWWIGFFMIVFSVFMAFTSFYYSFYYAKK